MSVMCTLHHPNTTKTSPKPHTVTPGILHCYSKSPAQNPISEKLDHTQDGNCLKHTHTHCKNCCATAGINNGSFTAPHMRVKSSNLSPPTDPCPHPPHSRHTRHCRCHRPRLWAKGSNPGPFPSCTCCPHTCGTLGWPCGSHEAQQGCWLGVMQWLST